MQFPRNRADCRREDLNSFLGRMTTQTQDNPDTELLALVRKLLAPEEVLEIRRCTNGQSNLTYVLACSGRKLVLRMKPPGILLKSAHLVEREFKVMSALRNTNVPVPETVVLVSDEDSPLGRAFYIMEFVEGDVHFDPALPDHGQQARKTVYAEMNRVLAEIHNVDLDRVGLSEFGKPGSYFERQTGRWKQQYYASRVSPSSDMDILVEWLEANMVEDDGQLALVHGDFRLDNLIFDHESCRAKAVIDWELSTLGHPLADLAYQCMQWRMPYTGALRGLGGLSRESCGLPQERQYLEDYCRRRRIPIPENWTFYVAFAFFRLAAILEGVKRRALDGNAANPELAVEYGSQVPLLAREAVSLLEAEA